MNEIWRTIPDIQNYEVSTQGAVRNKQTGRILKPSLNTIGKPQVVMMDAGVRVGRSVHKLVEDAFGSVKSQN